MTEVNLEELEQRLITLLDYHKLVFGERSMCRLMYSSNGETYDGIGCLIGITNFHGGVPRLIPDLAPFHASVILGISQYAARSLERGFCSFTDYKPDEYWFMGKRLMAYARSIGLIDYTMG